MRRRSLFVALPLGLVLLGPGRAAAQAGLGTSWGQPSTAVTARLLAAPGFELVAADTHGPVRVLTYGHVRDATVGLVFTFRHHSLVAFTRYVLVKNADRVAPDPDWRPLGNNEWAIAAENTRLTRRVEGLFLRDEMRRWRSR